VGTYSFQNYAGYSREICFVMKIILQWTGELADIFRLLYSYIRVEIDIIVIRYQRYLLKRELAKSIKEAKKLGIDIDSLL